MSHIREAVTAALEFEGDFRIPNEQNRGSHQKRKTAGSQQLSTQHSRINVTQGVALQEGQALYKRQSQLQEMSLLGIHPFLRNYGIVTADV